MKFLEIEDIKGKTISGAAINSIDESSVYITFTDGDVICIRAGYDRACDESSVYAANVGMRELVHTGLAADEQIKEHEESNPKPEVVLPFMAKY